MGRKERESWSRGRAEGEVEGAAVFPEKTGQCYLQEQGLLFQSSERTLVRAGCYWVLMG